MSEISNVMNDLWGAAPEDLQSKAAGKFGLNEGFLSKLEFNDKASKDGADGNAIDLTVKIGDREYYNRFFLNEQVYDNNNNLVGPGEAGYVDHFKNTYIQIGAVVKQALKSVGVTEAQIQAVPRVSVTEEKGLVPGFTTDVKNMLALLPQDFASKPIDVFLEYQWNIPEGKDRTYLTLPKNMKGGYFMLPQEKPVGKWTEVRSEEGLHYIDGAGNKHTFVRSSDYMESNKANQQGAGATPSEAAQVNPIQAAQKSTWD